MKATAFLLAVLTTGILPAQQPQFNFTFNHMALLVKDVNVSAEFNKKVFQLPEITNRTKIEGIRWISTGASKELHVISIIKQPITLNKATHLSLTTDKIEGFKKRLIEPTYFQDPMAIGLKSIVAAYKY